MSTRHADQEEITAKEAGRRLGMTDVSVGTWGRRSGAPVVLRGGRRYYLWPAFPRWREEQLTTRVPANLSEAQARKTAAQATLLEAQVARERGETHLDGECLQAFGKVLDGLRRHWLSVPGKWAPKLVGKKSLLDAQVALDELVAEIMTRVSSPDEAA